jgi:Fe-S-cluster-containing dehydrogenase component/CRP-like cAMP-binding protein
MSDAWPAAVWSAPLLRGLDQLARAALAHAGRVVDHLAGATIYREGDDSDSCFVVIAGAVELHAIRRGDETASLVRVARTGDSFGEEALLPGIPRRLTATTNTALQLAEVPIAVFRRITGRASTSDREERYLERAAARDLLSCSAFARELDGTDIDLLLDAARLERVPRSAHIYEPGDTADALYFVLDGLVQLQRDDAVTAYLSRGDFFGDQEALAGIPRRHAAVAAGDTWCAIVSRDALRTLADRNPGLLPRLRRVAESQEAVQTQAIDAAAARSTQHVFRDLYRMQMARSLLVIDQDSCVRCGHCAWSCEQVHGVSRLVRRGDKVVTQLAGSGAATLLLPNTCQQCSHAACMIDCPTGAIGRDPEGEVFIRASLCTGCGNCAKACPWENIQMAPRPAASPSEPPLVLLGSSRAIALGVSSAEIAVKCDLCHGYEAPACVEACPTGAVLRLDPSRDVAEVALVLGAAVPQRSAPRGNATAIGSAIGVAASIGLSAAGWAAHRAYAWTPNRGAGFAAGIAAAALVVALGAYVLPKRRVRARMKRRDPAKRLTAEASRTPRTRTRAHLIAHLGLGALVPAAALAHAGAHAGASPGDALAAALGATVIVGVLAALAYRLVPRALTRLERRGTLPEDLAAEREALETRLYAAVTGKSDRTKALVDHVIAPYARARLGALALIASGRGLADEERALRTRIANVLAGRSIESSGSAGARSDAKRRGESIESSGSAGARSDAKRRGESIESSGSAGARSDAKRRGELIDGVDELIRIAVELRALPARRALGFALRVWPPLHAIAGAVTVALLVVHVVLR